MYCFEDFYLKVNDYIRKLIDNNTGVEAIVILVTL